MIPPKAVLFDLGNTVLREEDFDMTAGRRRMLELSENHHGVCLETLTRAADELYAVVLPQRESAMMELSCRQFARLLYERLGITFALSPVELELEFWKSSTRMSPTPGIYETLDALAGRGLPIAVLSNSMFSQETLAWELSHHELSTRFGFVMSSADYGLRKPHSQLFLTAAAKLGVEPQHVWFVGDSLKHDIAGAQSVGMTAIWYNPDRAPSSEPLPDATISEWSELGVLLRQVASGSTGRRS
ncbi:MAG: HAD family hydrolase [Candidatus Hydrogenedentes bacterium]|nr:HAD family hydrolase [Candidatus Hydrogenedentota bacterium]